MRNILNEICDRRLQDIEKLGYSYGHEIPAERTRPVVPFLPKPGTILEVKRASPSKGDIAPGLDSAATAKSYIEAGTSAISVLTEENYFKGTLDDLKKVASLADSLGNKVAVLRKDFLLEPEEIEIAYRCGADAVLLIARILDTPKLLQMAAKAFTLGISILLELRDEDAVEKAFEVLKFAGKMNSFDKVVLGVNARDLKTFTIDMLIPLKIKSMIEKKLEALPENERPQNVRVISESGILSVQASEFTGNLGFDGILMGEAVARDPVNAANYVRAFLKGAEAKRNETIKFDFWKKVSVSLNEKEKSGNPLVKICGITNDADLEKCEELGADLLGFIFWDKSPRNANNLEVFEKETKALKVGVVVDFVTEEFQKAVLLLKDKKIDAIQLHGFSKEKIESFFSTEYKNLPHYFAVNVSSKDDLEKIELLQRYGEPRILVDAKVGDAIGGTGTSIPEELVNEVSKMTKLWLAGGLNPENAGYILNEFTPELMDASSGLEASKGVKDHAKLNAYFSAI